MILDTRNENIQSKIKALKRSISKAKDFDVSTVDTSNDICSYAKSMSVLNPITDAIHLVHGPIGCARYAWNVKSSISSGPQLLENCFSTDLKETDVIFGGERKLARSIRSLVKKYRPAAVFVYPTCIARIIGDDLEAVCKKASDEVSVPVVPVISAFPSQSKGIAERCEGYDAACTAIIDLIGKRNYRPKSPYTINILGEYNIAGDLWPIRSYFEEIGIEVISTITGDARVAEIQRAHFAGLNLVSCSSSMNCLAKKMYDLYDIPFRRVSFLGIQAMSFAIKSAVRFYDDPFITKEATEMINSEYKRIRSLIERYKDGLAGKRAAIFVNGAGKAASLIDALEELGMETSVVSIRSGDYVDRQKVFNSIGSSCVFLRSLDSLDKVKLLTDFKVDILISAFDDQYIAYKIKMPYLNVGHDRKIAFEGYNGMVELAQEIDKTINSRVWKLPFARKGQMFATGEHRLKALRST